MSELEYEVSDSSVSSESQSSRHSSILVFRGKDLKSIGFIFHNSVDEEVKVTLSRDIKKHGGAVLNSDVGANTLLIAPEQDKTVIQLACNSSRNTARANLRVEYISFIWRCIKRGYFRHTRSTIKPMHGVPEGNGRTKFTSDDFENLCWCISRLLPDPSIGGRQSLKFYTDLIHMGRESEYHWVRRHTAESWKEHYKKNKEAYKTRIQELVEQHPPDPERRWIHDRRLTKSSMRKNSGIQPRLDEGESSGNESSQVESQDETDVVTQNSRTFRKRKSPAVTSGTMQSAKRPRVSENAIARTGEEKFMGRTENPEVEEQDSLFDADAEFQFDDYGPGPSGELRSPERTLVASVDHPSFLTQGTLVGSPAVKHVLVARKKVSIPRNNNQRARHRQQIRDATSTPPPTDPPTIPLPPMQAKSYPAKPLKAARRRLVQQPDSPKKVSVPQQQQSNQHRSPRDKEILLPIVQVRSKFEKKKRNEATATAVRTSSRLRSIEPEITPLPSGRKAFRHHTIAMAEEQEVHDAPNIETLVEELFVENVLEDGHDIGSLGQPSGPYSELSMDSDDIRISANLRARSSNTKSSKSFDFLTAPHPKDMLKRSRLALHSTAPKRPTPQPTSQTLDKTQQVRKSALSGLGNKTLTISKRQQRGSSVDTYPLPGTRAESMVQSLQKVESHSRYSPPIGTKAAAFSQGLQ